VRCNSAAHAVEHAACLLQHAAVHWPLSWQHEAVHWLWPLQQADDSADSSVTNANSDVAAVQVAVADGAHVVAAVAASCFVHGHSPPPHFSPQIVVVAAVKTAVAVIDGAVGSAAADSAFWQHGFSQSQPFSQEAHSAAAAAVDSVAVICSIANTLVVNAVKIKTGSVDFMSHSPWLRAGKNRADRDSLRPAWQCQFRAKSCYRIAVLQRNPNMSRRALLE
jgi:hypothetical protein